MDLDYGDIRYFRMCKFRITLRIKKNLKEKIMKITTKISRENLQ